VIDKLILLGGAILSSHTMSSMAAEHSVDLYNKVYIDVTCSVVKGIATLKFHNMTGTYVNIEGANDKFGIWESDAIKVVQKKSYSEHYTRWEYARKNKFSSYEDNDPISSLVLAPYSKREFDIFYDKEFELKSGDEYVLYLTFSAYINSYPLDFKVFRSNRLLTSSDNCY